MMVAGTFQISIVVALTLAVLFNAQCVQGISCYECAEAPEAPKDQTCSHVLSKGKSTKCSVAAPYCLQITGVVNGKNVEARSCGESNWNHLLGGSDKCLPSDKIMNFKFSLSQKEVHLKDGIVCICDSDNCNPAGKPEPIFAITAITALAGSVLAYWKLQ